MIVTYSVNSNSAKQAVLYDKWIDSKVFLEFVDFKIR